MSVRLPSSTRALHGGDRELMLFLSITWEITKGNFVPESYATGICNDYSSSRHGIIRRVTIRAMVSYEKDGQQYGTDQVQVGVAQGCHWAGHNLRHGII